MDVRGHDRPGRAEVGFVERGKAGDAQQREANRDLVFEDLEEPYDPRTSGRGEAVDIETADRHRIGAEDHCLDDIGAAADPAIDDDAGAPTADIELKILKPSPDASAVASRPGCDTELKIMPLPNSLAALATVAGSSHRTGIIKCS